MLIRKFAIASLLGLATLFAASSAHAQTATRGAIKGFVSDSRTGTGLDGAMVTVTSPALQQPQTAMTSASGTFRITNLPPGDYLVQCTYLEAVQERRKLEVQINFTTTANFKFDSDAAATAGGRTVLIEEKAPTIDTTSTSIGVKLNQEYVDNVPQAGRTFEAALGATPGSSGDGMGVSFSGSSSLENQYVVDGVSTTNVNFGTVGSSLLTDFLEEIEVLSGGFNAEYGRATGGIVLVGTKSGSNEFKGSFFMYGTHGIFAKDSARTPRESFSLDVTTNRGFTGDFGFELGGPIVKDKVWFYVGFAPRFNTTDITTIAKSRTDCRQPFDPAIHSDADRDPNFPSLTVCRGMDTSGNLNFADQAYDENPDNGFAIFDDLCDPDNSYGDARPDCEVETQKVQAYQWVSKISFAAAPEHQGQVTFNGQTASTESPGVFGETVAVNRDASAQNFDLTGKWTSKFNNNKTEIDAVVGFHSETFQSGSIVSQADDFAAQTLLFGSLGVWSRGTDLLGNARERDYTRAGCRDSTNAAEDPYPLVTNCPDAGVGYTIGGPGTLVDDNSQRISGRVSVTQRVTAAGTHEFKAGLDAENNTIDNLRALSGGAFYRNFLGEFGQPQQVDALRWVRVAPEGGDPNQFPDACGQDNVGFDVACRHLGKDRVTGETFNWSAFLQDSWQILPNLTLNAGLRYEEQRLRYREDLQDSRDPVTGNLRGKNAIVLDNNWAPRIGVVYDWTKEGRAKVTGFWGRFYDNIPMRINERSFGGEALLQQTYASTQCGPTDDGIGGPDGTRCADEGATPSVDEGQIIGGSGVLVAPGLRAQYLDEFILGVEYEVLEDLKLGVSFQNRAIKRVLEDVSTDNAATYVFANPGEWSKDEEDKISGAIDDLTMGGADPAACNATLDAESDDCRLGRLQDDLERFRGIRVFDKPTRNYNALTVTAQKRFSKNFGMQAAYTYSVLDGNYPGKFSADTGQVDPNLTSQFDLVELLANSKGRLPNDRPHYIKLDGWYTFDFGKRGVLRPGFRFRALSGTPVDALGAHYLYGFNEAYLLPRGSVERTDWQHSLDLRVQYAVQLAKGINIELFFDLFNSYGLIPGLDNQGVFSVDEAYTRDDAIPVVGGTLEDLVFLKSLSGSGAETSDAVSRNPNYRNPAGRYSPGYAQFGMRVNF